MKRCGSAEGGIFDALEEALMTRERPNVIFLMLDTVAADGLRVYGGEVPMRNIEELGRRGTVYRNAVAPGTYTLTSHASIFTGKRVRKIKSLLKNPVIRHNQSTDPLFLKNRYIEYGEPTLAARMSYLGYKTALFSNNPFITESTGLSTGFAFVRNPFMENKLKYHRTTLRIIGNDFMRKNLTRLAYHISSVIPSKGLDGLYLRLRKTLNRKVCRETGAYMLDQGADATNRMVSEYLCASGARGQFIFINYMEAHEGYPTNMVTRREISQDRWMYVSGMIDSRDVGVLKKAYAMRLEYLDRKIGSLISTLREKGALDNAVLVIASDHGQAFMEHGQLYHTLFPYNEISHVPLITARFVGGKQLEERSVVEESVSLSALYDSILEIGYGKSDRINGSMTRDEFVFSDHTGMLDVWDIPLLKMFRGRSRNAELLYRTKLKYNTFASAVYFRNYKLIHYYGRRMGSELYDLSKDPHETDNIIDANAQIASRMAAASRDAG